MKLAYLGPTAPYARPSGSINLEADFVTDGHFVLKGYFCVGRTFRVGRTGVGRTFSVGRTVFVLTKRMLHHIKNYYLWPEWAANDFIRSPVS